LFVDLVFVLLEMKDLLVFELGPLDFLVCMGLYESVVFDLIDLQFLTHYLNMVYSQVNRV